MRKGKEMKLIKINDIDTSIEVLDLSDLFRKVCFSAEDSHVSDEVRCELGELGSSFGSTAGKDLTARLVFQKESGEEISYKTAAVRFPRRDGKLIHFSLDLLAGD